MSREKIVTVKCSEKEYVRICHAADRSEMAVSTYLRELGTEGRCAKRKRRNTLISAVVRMTQACNEYKGQPEIQKQIQREVDSIWQIL